MIIGETSLVELVGVSRTFTRGSEQIRALQQVTCQFEQGSLCALGGVSGSGKSTLLNVVAGLVRPDEGVVRVAGEDITGWSPDRLARLRRESVFLIYQEFNLVASLTVAENAALTLLFKGVVYRDAVKAGEAALDKVGLDGLGAHMPNELSGGQRQRVAVARALVGHQEAPTAGIVLADEPTGALDSSTARQLFELLRDLARAGAAVLVASHDPMAAEFADRQLTILDGHLSEAS